MSLRAGLLALVLAIGFAGRAGSEEVTLGMLGTVRWDTNAFNDGDKQVNAWLGSIGPRVRVTREDHRLSYAAQYQAQYEESIDRDSSNAWQHLGKLEGSLDLSPRTRMEFSNRTTSQERPVFFSNVDDPGDLPGAEDDDDDNIRTTRNLASFSMTHQLNRRHSFSGSFSHSLIESSSSRRFDSTSISGSLSTGYSWSARHQYSLGVSGSFSSIDGNDRSSGSRTTSGQVFAGWTYAVDPSLVFSVQGGPTVVRTRSKRDDASGQQVPRYRPAGVQGDGFAWASDNCVEALGENLFSVYQETNSGGLIGNPQCFDRVVSGPNGEPLSDLGISDDEFTSIDILEEVDNEATVTFFGEASITKQWRNLSGRLAYRRTESPSTQSGGSTSVDLVSGSLDYNPPGPWSARLAGTWSLRRSLSDVAVTQVQTTSGPQFVESVEDSGLRGLDTFGRLRPIAQAGGLVTTTLDNSIETYQWSVLFSLQRRLEDNGTVALDLRYRRRNEKGDFGNGTAGRFVATLRFEYHLDPFEL